MAASTISVGTEGRIAVFGDISGILVTVTATVTQYTTASGGLPVDLAPVLNDLSGGAPFSQPYINPKDIVGLIAIGTVAAADAANGNHFEPGDLAVGTPTFTNPAVWPFAGGVAGSIQPSQQLATCPATFRLWNGTTELANATITATVTFLLIIARGGTNS